jgi:hypothetical protein
VVCHLLTQSGHAIRCLAQVNAAGRPYAAPEVRLLGVAIMVAAATTISWYRSVKRRGSALRPPATKPRFAAGEA